MLALVDENKIEKIDLNRSFENEVLFVFYWDLFEEKVVKNRKIIRVFDLIKNFVLWN